MSVRTTADEYLDLVKDNITDAIRNLEKVTSIDTWGNDEYSDEYIELLSKYLLELKNMKRKID